MSAAEPVPDGSDWFRAEEGKKEKAPAEDEFAELYGTDAIKPEAKVDDTKPAAAVPAGGAAPSGAPQEEDEDVELVLDQNALDKTKSQPVGLRSQGGPLSLGRGFRHQVPPTQAQTSAPGAPRPAMAPAAKQQPLQLLAGLPPAGRTGKSVIDMADAELGEERPWRRPGADITDYFNYGFNEETWKYYIEKQRQLRAEYQMQGKIRTVESTPMIPQAPLGLPPEMFGDDRRSRDRNTGGAQGGGRRPGGGAGGGGGGGERKIEAWSGDNNNNRGRRARDDDTVVQLGGGGGPTDALSLGPAETAAPAPERGGDSGRRRASPPSSSSAVSLTSGSSRRSPPPSSASSARRSPPRRTPPSRSPPRRASSPSSRRSPPRRSSPSKKSPSRDRRSPRRDEPDHKRHRGDEDDRKRSTRR